MLIPVQLDPGRATITLVLMVLSVLVLVVTSYRYLNGDQSAEQYYSTGSMFLIWVAYGLLLLSDSFSGRVATGVLALSYVATFAFLAAVVQWWRYRGTGE